jgi:hypothetical protein
MRRRLYDYVILPNRRRKSADQWTLISAVVWSAVSVLLGTSGIDASKEGLFVVAAGVLATTAWNVLRHPEPRIETTDDVVIFRRPLLASALTSLAIVVGISGKQLDAAIVTKRLKRALSGNPPYIDADRIIAEALANNTPGTPAALDALSAKLRVELDQEPAKDERLRVAQTLLNLNMFRLYSWTNLKLRGLSLPAVGLEASGKYKVNGTLTVHALYLSGRGRQVSGILFVPDKPIPLFDFRLDLGDALVTDMSFSLTGAPGSTFSRIESGYKGLLALVNVDIVGFDQDLDAVTFCQVTFTKCNIRYNNGPLSLFAVRFTDCQFWFSESVSASTIKKVRQGNQPVYLERN